MPDGRVADLEDSVNHWKRDSVLEKGRNQVLKMVATGKPIDVTLQTLCDEARAYNPDMYCSILGLNPDDDTFFPIAATGIPTFYSEALRGVKIGQGVGSCGTAAFNKKRVIVEDINTHPYWVQYKELALSAGLQSCWSEPIIGENGRCFGSFAIYYGQPTAPSEEDIHFIEVSANLAAVVFDNHENRAQLVKANQELTRTLDERSQQLAVTIKELELTLKEQGRSFTSNIKREKTETTRSLVVGVAHEFSTPLGIAVTSMTTAIEAAKHLQNAIDSNQPFKKSFLVDKTNHILSALTVGDTSLTRATELIERFKSINTDEFDQATTEFCICDYLQDLKQLMTGLLGRHQLEIDVEPFQVTLSKYGLTQILLQLIENSVRHGFADMEHGIISLNMKTQDNQLVINYQDNGIGIPSEDLIHVFEPFFTTKNGPNDLGLGLNIASNIATNLYHGTLSAVPAPVGARFEITIPI